MSEHMQADPGRPTPLPEGLYLLIVHGDEVPKVSGPWSDERERVSAARAQRAAPLGDECGLYRLNVGSHRSTVEAFGGAELEHDPFIENSQAPALGLYLVHAGTHAMHGPLYDVRRAEDERVLFTGIPAAVGPWLRGYAAALGHPALEALNHVVTDEDAGNDKLLDAAQAVADLPPGGIT